MPMSVTTRPNVLVIQADQFRFDLIPISFIAQKLAESKPQRTLRIGPARQPRIEDRLRQILAPVFIQQIPDRGKVEHIIADRDSRLSPPFPNRENCQRQVLDRKIAALRTLAPALERRVVGAVDHGSFAFGKPAHASS